MRSFGAKGGRSVDTAAINAAIEAAAAAGGGTVYLPAGVYASFSIQLKSHVTLQLGPGAENETAHPEPSMFGTLPAYGFYLRHARNVTLRDVRGLSGHDSPGLASR